MKRRPYSRSGLHTLKRLVKTHGLNALDHRSAPVRALWGWRSELLAALGGERVVTPQQEAIVDLAVRTRLYVDHVDAFLIGQRSLINKKRKAVLPVLRERQTLADGLARLLGQRGQRARGESSRADQARSSERPGRSRCAGSADGRRYSSCAGRLRNTTA